jgi:hypothetical protein
LLWEWQSPPSCRAFQVNDRASEDLPAYFDGPRDDQGRQPDALRAERLRLCEPPPARRLYDSRDARDARALHRQLKLIALIKRPFEGGLVQDGLAVQRLDKAGAAAGAQQQRVIAAHALHARADSGGGGQVRRDPGGHLVVRPFARALNE